MDQIFKWFDRIGTGDVIALVLVLVSSYMWISTGDIPSSLESATLIVVGFFFGDNLRKRVSADMVQALNPKPPQAYIPE